MIGKGINNLNCVENESDCLTYIKPIEICFVTIGEIILIASLRIRISDFYNQKSSN